MKDILKLIEDYGLVSHPIKDGDSHVQVDCPLCTDTRKRLGIKIDKPKNEKEGDHFWHCFNCGSRSRSLKGLRRSIDKLKQLDRKTFVEYKNNEVAKIKQGIAEKCHELLLTEEKKFALDYLIEERGLSLECVKFFKLGFRSKFKSRDGDSYDAGPHISLPAFEGDKSVYIKYRNIDPEAKKDRKWKREVGGKTVLFNDQVTSDHDYDSVFICESEIDTMSLWSNGFKNVIGLTAGADTFEKQQEWYDKLERFEKIYIVLDNDVAGQTGAKKIAYRLGLGRCYNIVLPEDTKDPNEYFKKYTKEDFYSLVKKSQRFNPELVQPLREVIKEAIDELTNDVVLNDGLQTGIVPFDNIMGSIQGGNLIVVAARPKCGKCVGADTIVIDPETMKPLTIEEAIKNKQKTIHSYNEETKKLEICEISDWIDSGVKPMVRLETRLGRSVDTTYSHRYLTLDGWKYVSELKIGEKIAVPTRFDYFGEEEWDEEKLSWIIPNLKHGLLTEIPKIIFSLNKESMLFFLKEVFSNNSIKTEDKNLIDNLDHLLTRFGVNAQKYFKDGFWNLGENDYFSNLSIKEALELNPKIEEVSFVEVTSITDIGGKQCYDLTVPKHENFIGNDIVCHNTTFMLNVAYRMAKLYNIKSFNYQCEMDKKDLLFSYVKMSQPQKKLEELPKVKRDKNGKPIFRNNIEKLDYERIKANRIDMISSARGALMTSFLHSFHPYSQAEIELDKICEKIEQTVSRFGCKVVIFDNLLFLCRGDKAKEAVDMATQRFKMLARKLNIVIFLVTHPKKTNHNRELEPDDLKESGSIFQDADAVVLLHRELLDDDNVDNNEESAVLSEVMQIKVIARRHKGGRAKVLFKGDKSLIIDKHSAVLEAMEKEQKGGA